MKVSIKLIILVIVCGAFASTGFAQSVSASATVSATIIAPLAIARVTDLDFGNVAVGSLVGTVVITPAGARSVTGSCQLSATNPGSVTAAAFAITGQGSYTYGITLPSAATSITGSGAAMSVDTYLSNPGSTGTLTSGSQTINVGGTLHVAGNQTAGLYTLASGLTVSVFYN